MRQNQNNSKHFGVIDIGSVAIRAEVLSINPQDPSFFTVSFAERQMPKLGTYGPNSTIKEESLSQSIEYLMKFQNALSNWKCENSIAVGTAVFRQASNGTQAIKYLENKLKLNIQVISEIEEAILIAEGIIGFEKNLPFSYLLLDIGGRSSEISYVEKGKILGSISLPLGAISIQNNFFKLACPTSEEEIKAKKFINETLLHFTKDFPYKSDILIGSSGTLRMLQRMLFQTKIPNPNFILVDMVHRLYQALKTNEGEAKKLLEQEKNRFELIYSGLLILDEVSNFLQTHMIKVSKFSLRHGLLKRMLKNSLDL